MDEKYDVVVVGGGAAGLSGAVALARSRRSVLVVDSGEPRNAPAGHVHNYLGRESTPPGELLAIGRSELAGYGGEVVNGTVTSLDRRDNGDFAVGLADGRTVRARRLLVATGLKDELPEVAGLQRRWGRDVLHCPYCHGWEARDQAIGILATGPMSLHQAQMWRQLSDDVVVFRHTAPAFDATALAELAARGIHVVDGLVTGLEVSDDHLTGVRMESGEVVARDALAIAPRFTARAELLAPLGLRPEPVEINGYVVGDSVPADASGATSVPGVWLAGNVATMMAQVSASASSGLAAGAAINADLIKEEVADAVRRSGEPFSHRTERAVAAAVGARQGHAAPPDDQESWEARYRTQPGIWSGQPNEQLVTEAAGLMPGHALDAGCGEGGDAVWLAQQGWQVTAVDFSSTAVERGRARAEKLGVADRIEWVVADLATWQPDRKFELATTHFLHIPPAARVPAFTRLADAVAPGGTLLVVGHHPSGLHATLGRPDMLFTAEEVAETLDGSWDSVTVDTRARTATGPEGEEVSLSDSVLVARRR
ncbi:bifunctional NAD(P)/FAD-dependent oxidoreductase/class I SAM-dependent methyltransferase [Amycolatopsis jiangsuensis]|uniref:Thioredoxin reductase/predicted O-methyltransferase YrrM n=1 Tax=Amycolatopsis jiangsuensis TaxID=1181879 RepID=A0A840IVN2_9PSEU|nr:bifunctional NAD(P)/FAD-dependent oxidoreductase/class I SAM-dependent methyltransferase [Amycolatopsis jiangsuensis]MBB4685579.1 thioredoxin reductase/predicted O-methyltransferase YrrM [Amycolatopsis jiangsuensis]